jgi:hypothetical protein
MTAYSDVTPDPRLTTEELQVNVPVRFVNPVTVSARFAPVVNVPPLTVRSPATVLVLVVIVVVFAVTVRLKTGTVKFRALVPLMLFLVRLPCVYVPDIVTLPVDVTRHSADELVNVPLEANVVQIMSPPVLVRVPELDTPAEHVNA